MEKILVIDDEIKMLRIMSELLTLRGYGVITAQSGREGIKIFKEEAPLLVIVDIIMPGVDGIEVLNEIKRLSSNTEVIMVTAYEDSDLAIKSLHFEASDFITKPINPDELFISIKRAEEKLLIKKQLQEYTTNLEKLLTERTRKMLQLEKQAIIGDFIEGIVPHIRDPLSVIATRAEFLSWKLKEMLDTLFQSCEYIEEFKQMRLKMEKNIQDVETILKNARCITTIMENILVKSVQGHTDKEEFIDINQMIQQEVMFFGAYFKNRIEQRYYLYHRLKKVKMVYSDLSLIFDNLIKNAIEAMYTSSRKKLTIKTVQDEKNIYVDFIDTGRGIPEKMIENIFDPFFGANKRSAELTMDEPQIGGGGLYTCMFLIKKYGGTIKVKSRLNEGSRFRVVIPIRQCVVKTAFES